MSNKWTWLGVEPVGKNRSGFAYREYWTNYSREVRKELKNWNPLITWTVKDLRNCLMTFASINGLSNDLWEQYVGHAPKSVTARHYVPHLASTSNGVQQLLRYPALLSIQSPSTQKFSGI